MEFDWELIRRERRGTMLAFLRALRDLRGDLLGVEKVRASTHPTVYGLSPASMRAAFYILTCLAVTLSGSMPSSRIVRSAGRARLVVSCLTRVGVWRLVFRVTLVVYSMIWVGIGSAQSILCRHNWPAQEKMESGA